MMTMQKNISVDIKIKQLKEVLFSTFEAGVTGVKGTVRLPAKGKVSPPILVAAIDQLLQEHFNIKLSTHQKNAFVLYEPFYAEVPSSPGLPSRTISSDFDAPQPQFHIIGKQPKDGENGFVEVGFDWKKRAGTAKQDGTFDWKKINSVPSIRENDVIATIHDKTEGVPGVDCFGKKISQRPGARHKVRWASDYIKRDIEDDNARRFNLIAMACGVIDYSFLINNDPRTLDWVKILDTLKIQGDIDYTLGDLDSAASLDIEGNVRGNFSLRSDGHIRVNGTIEGQEVTAKSVSADLITNRCRVSALEDIDTNSITSAEVRANYIRIRQNASRSVIDATEKVIMDEGVSLAGLKIHTKHIKLDRPLISGQNEIVLGEKLFNKVNQLRPLLKENQDVLKEKRSEVKEFATELLNNVALLNKFSGKYGAVVHNLLDGIKNDLVNSFQYMKNINEKTIESCHELLNLLGDRNAELSLLGKVEYIYKSIPIYNNIQADLLAIENTVESTSRELEQLEREIKNDIAVILINAKTTGANAELKVTCGTNELALTGNALVGGDKEIRYHVTDDENFASGKLLLS